MAETLIVEVNNNLSETSTTYHNIKRLEDNEKNFILYMNNDFSKVFNKTIYDYSIKG